jgi:hypothetical protein
VATELQVTTRLDCGHACKTNLPNHEISMQDGKTGLPTGRGNQVLDTTGAVPDPKSETRGTLDNVRNIKVNETSGAFNDAAVNLGRVGHYLT